jgi:hypothetical protein
MRRAVRQGVMQHDAINFVLSTFYHVPKTGMSSLLLVENLVLDERV